MRVPLIALEVVLGFVVPIGWATWELVSLRRERERDRQKAEAARLDVPASGPGAASGTAASPAPRAS